MTRRQLIGSLGCIILLLGVFAPVIKLPVIGSINYFNDGKSSGAVVLVLAIVSYVLLRIRFVKGLWATGIGTLGLLAVSFIRIERKLHGLRSDMDANLSGTLLKGFGELASKSIQLQWGWAVLIIGAALILLAASMKESTAGPTPGKEVQQ